MLISMIGLSGTEFSFGLVLAVLALAVLVFEIVMLVSAITNRRISDTAKILWVIGMLFIHPFVAIIYYFTDYQKAGKA